MSVHTMPPMSLICEDFIKSMVKPIDSKSPNDLSYHSNTPDDALTTRLNGNVNGYGSHSDDDEDEDKVPDGNSPMTNGSYPSNVSSKNMRKDLLNKTEELKRQQKSFGISAAHEEEEKKLRCMARQVINLDF